MIRRETDARGVATLTIDRPDVANAIDEATIAALTGAFANVADDESIRAVVLTGSGVTFCAGADLAWMRRASTLSREGNLDDAGKLASLLQAIDRCPKPTLALVNGPAFGGGVGLVACCDIAVAASNASFRLSEVRLGLVPGTIGPYVVAAMGARATRRLAITAARFDAATALSLGLVHEVVAEAELSQARERIVAMLLGNGPAAMAATKRLIATVAGRAVDDELQRVTAEFIADARAGEEGIEGVAAFIEKRKPRWSKE